jgi:phosphate transport system protein
MPKRLQKEIEKLKRDVLYLTAKVEENLRMAVAAVTQRDADLGRKVVENDHRIDAMEVELEEECLKILALYQPVAIDLRFIIAVLKINSDLERIGDLAVNIAERTDALVLAGRSDVPYDLAEMLHLTIAMVKKSADALVDLDPNLADEVCGTDDEVDNHHRMAYGLIEDQIRQHPEAATYYINLLSISRNLERIADHATNIAQDVIYMVEGEIVRHKGRPTSPPRTS